MKKREPIRTGYLPSRHANLFLRLMNLFDYSTLSDGGLYEFLVCTRWTCPGSTEPNRHLKADGQRLRMVLSQIEQQTAARFVYSSKTINANQPVTIKLKETAERSAGRVAQTTEINVSAGGWSDCAGNRPRMRIQVISPTTQSG